MRRFCKFILVIFSVIILVLGVVINLLAINLLDLDLTKNMIQNILTGTPSSQIVLVVTEICMIFAVIGIFSDTSDEKDSKGGRDVLMQNANGRLIISKDTIENLVDVVVKKFDGALEPKTRIQLDEENNVIVLVDLSVTNDVVIKELTVSIQNKIKEAIKRTSDLEVKEVNVRIKNIANKEEKPSKEKVKEKEQIKAKEQVKENEKKEEMKEERKE